MTLGIVFSLNFVVLLTWTLVAPLEWTRTVQPSRDIFDRYVSSYASCTNDDALAFSIVIVVLNVGFLLLANWWAYVSRNIETEYRESLYIGISMASVLQAWCMGVPILIVVWDYPSAKFFVGAGIVFVTALALLLLVYSPKVLAIRADHIKRRREEKRDAYPQHKDRSRNNDVFDEEDDLCDDKVGATMNSSDNNGSDEGRQTNSPKESCNTNGTASLEMTKTNCRESEDETIAAPAIAVGAIPPVLSRGSKDCPHGIVASGFALRSDNNTETKGGIKVLHNNPKVRFAS